MIVRDTPMYYTVAVHSLDGHAVAHYSVRECLNARVLLGAMGG